MLNESHLHSKSVAHPRSPRARGNRWRGFIAALAAVLAAGSLAWAGSAVASGSGGGDVWFTGAQVVGGTVSISTPNAGYSVAVDSQDVPIVVGRYKQTVSFPTGRPAPDDSIILTAPGDVDGFVAALNADDTYFAWAIPLGSDDEAIVESVAISTGDAPVITGRFRGSLSLSTGQPAPNDSISLASTPGIYNMFVAGLNADDSSFAWAVNLGGNLSGLTSGGRAIENLGDDSLVVTGDFAGTLTLPTGRPAPNDSIVLTATNRDTFVAALNSDDSYFAWGTVTGGAGNSYVRGLDVTDDSSILLAGRFDGAMTFPTGPGTSVSLNSTGLVDAYVAKINADDSYFSWATRIGGTGITEGNAIASLGNTPIVTGIFNSVLSLPTGKPAPDDSITLTPMGTGFNAFVASMSADGSTFSWAAQVGGVGAAAFPWSIQVDASGSPVIAGDFGGTIAFPTGKASPDDSITLTALLGQDAFVAGLNADDSYFAWVRSVPSNSNGRAWSLALTADDSPIITGYLGRGTAYFPNGSAAPDDSFAFSVTAGSEIFVGWLDPFNATPAPSPTPTPTPGPNPPPAVVPSAPVSVSGSAGDGSAVVSWAAPVSSGSFPISTYQAQVSPGGQSCLVSALVTSCTIDGLTNGQAYTATVRALSGAGWGPYSSASQPFTPDAPVASIVITGTRGEVRGRPGVVVNGTTTGFGEGAILRPWVRFPGQIRYAEGTGRILVDDGAFTWQRRTGKKTYVVVKTPDGDVKSNRVIIPARE